MFAHQEVIDNSNQVMDVPCFQHTSLRLLMALSCQVAKTFSFDLICLFGDSRQASPAIVGKTVWFNIVVNQNVFSSAPPMSPFVTCC